MGSGLMTRIQRSVLTTVGLAALYLVYSQVTRHLLTVPRSATIERSYSEATVAPGSMVFRENAERWFPRSSWVPAANGRFRDGDRLLFFGDHQLLNQNRSIEVSPLAMLWEGSGDDRPVTLTAEAAQLDASTRFSLGEGQFGRITRGVLSGEVRIDGPSGMRIQGHTFHLSEDSMRIWTSEPVSFAWESHSGYAEGGAEIELSGGETRDMTDIQSVHRLRLLGRIRCDLSFENKREPAKAIRVSVNAANGFEYFFPTREATFFGFVDRELRPDYQIVVESPVSATASDRLFCSQLTLQLQPKISAAPQNRKSTQVEVSTITAGGRRVRYESAERRMTAEMTQLRYHLDDRVLELEGRSETGASAALPVDVNLPGRRLSAPFISVSLDERSQPRIIECLGAGSMVPQPVLGQTAQRSAGDGLRAGWQTALTLLRTSLQDRITLRGQAELDLPEQSLYLVADEVQLETERLAEPATMRRAGGGNPGSGIPRKLEASGNIRLESPMLSGRISETLAVNLRDTVASDPAASGGASSSAGSLAEAMGGGGRGRTRFECQTIEVSLLRNSDGMQRLDDLWLRGNVVVTHDVTGDDEQFSAEANILHARVTAGGGQRISLTGDPAAVIRDSARIDGPRIELKDFEQGAARERTAEVNGGGRIRFVVSNGLSGRSLNRATPLDIYWNEQMKFAGSTAEFRGNVRAVMNNEVDLSGELSCNGMKVFFTGEPGGPAESSGIRAVSARTTPDAALDSSGGRSIERIQCTGRVVIDADLKTDGVVTGHHHAEFSDLQFNQLTGDFQGLGPGVIESVQPDTSGSLMLSRRPTVRSNTPVQTPNQACIFLRATFIESIEGNHRGQYVRLRHHVRGVFGPVRSLHDELDLEQLTTSELPDNTGTLGCENLTVSVFPRVGREKNSFNLVAESNPSGGSGGTRAPCRLSSRLFSGTADKITYDHAKQQYILKAEEDRKARVSYLPDGGRLQTLIGQRFEYYAGRNHLNADAITGMQADGGL